MKRVGFWKWCLIKIKEVIEYWEVSLIALGLIGVALLILAVSAVIPIMKTLFIPYFLALIYAIYRLEQANLNGKNRKD